MGSRFDTTARPRIGPNRFIDLLVHVATGAMVLAFEQCLIKVEQQCVFRDEQQVARLLRRLARGITGRHRGRRGCTLNRLVASEERLAFCNKAILLRQLPDTCTMTGTGAKIVRKYRYVSVLA
jgi:hypothetical protein